MKYRVRFSMISSISGMSKVGVRLDIERGESYPAIKPVIDHEFTDHGFLVLFRSFAVVTDLLYGRKDRNGCRRECEGIAPKPVST
jgi:hypothetical protein